jgi:hypothetical protein
MTPTPKRLRSENRPIAPSNPEDMTSWTRTALNKPTSTDTVPVLLEYFGKGLVVVPWAIVQLSRWRQRQAFYLTRFFVFFVCLFFPVFVSALLHLRRPALSYAVAEEPRWQIGLPLRSRFGSGRASCFFPCLFLFRVHNAGAQDDTFAAPC